MAADFSAAREEEVDERKRGGFADVVGARFESETPDGDRFALQVLAEVLVDLLDQHLFLGVIHVIDGVEDTRLEADFAGHAREGADVFGEAATAVADAGEEELEADANVMADAATDVIDVALQAFAKIGHFVDEANLCGEQRVGDVLGEFGAFGRHRKERFVGAEEWSVKLFELFGRGRLADADNDAVGEHEVLDRGAFFEELGIAGDEAGAPGGLFQTLVDPGVGADRDGALGDDDGFWSKVWREGVDDFPECGKIGGAVIGGRSADGEIDHVDAGGY